MGKIKSSKRKIKPEQEDQEDVPPPSTRSSDEPVPKKTKWVNRTRVLVFATRGITHQDRHLLKDLRTMLPHSRDENKMERGEGLQVVNEMCSMKNCDKCILLENKGHKDLYMWFANVVEGPSAKFLVESVYTMGELKLTGNCLRGSRPLLSFDETFDTNPHYTLLKELFVQILGTPNHHPKSQPFTDRVITFSILDNRIWFRNYQILSEDGALAEIGPRFVLNPIKIFEDSFGGRTLWENPKFVTPQRYRQMLKLAASNKYTDRKQQREAYVMSRPKESYATKPNDDIFEGHPLEKAKEISDKVSAQKEQTKRPLTKKEKQRKRKKKIKLSLKKPASSVEVSGRVMKKAKKNKLKKKRVQNGFSVS